MASNGERSQLGSHGSYMNACIRLEMLAMGLDGSGAAYRGLPSGYDRYVWAISVLNELEGLARGADARDCPPASKATLNPEYVAQVAESAKAALAFARSRNPAIRCLTTRGTVLTSSTFTVEEDVDKDGLISNDDKILTTCLSLCRSSKDQANAEEGQPRRLRREVVLLTKDRNLRVKALARDVPVREVPDFMQWAGLG
ncbi:PREDICTED: telomerase-binding protein EST1A-like [Wasmannia auropunctata]|uniref:telomerase-binding protein EST1A-like n=1 Tax=Wasmannia auropunctata TaxID=64793 RepID=UPI0005EEBA95|nr:PREDICTED: telomerase-binding protein EST1A-like [Wasmannia auropunctata]